MSSFSSPTKVRSSVGLTSPTAAGSSTLTRTRASPSSTSPSVVSRATTTSSSLSNSPSAGIKSGLKKLSVSTDEDNPNHYASPVRSSVTTSSSLSAGSSSALRTRASPKLTTSVTSSSYGLSSPTANRASLTTSSTSAAGSTISTTSSIAASRRFAKAVVQSPTAASVNATSFRARPSSSSSNTHLAPLSNGNASANTTSPYGASSLNVYSNISNSSPASNASSSAYTSASSGYHTPTQSSPAPSSPAPSSSTTSTSTPTQSRQAYAEPHSPIASAQKKVKSPGTSGLASPAANRASLQAGTTTGARRPLTYSAYDAQTSYGGHTYNTAAGAATAHTHHHSTHNGITPAGAAATSMIFSPLYHRTNSQENLKLKQEEEKAAKTKGEEVATINGVVDKFPHIPNTYVSTYQPPVVEEDDFDPFLFIKLLPPLSPSMKNRRSPIPKKALKAPPISLALDLDETLVHCSVTPMEKSELTFKVQFNGMDYEVYVRFRPHMKEFLQTVSQWFEVIIFTASQKVYADKLLNIIDPNGEYIKHRVFRDSCVNVDGNYLKDLHILGRDMNSVAIVDNSVQAFGFQLDNGIPIESWFDDDNDRELLNLLPFLKILKDQKDVRPLIRDTFRLSEFVASL